MAKKQDYKCCHGKKLIGLGALVLVVGLLRYYGFSWDVVLMVAGALILLKGLIAKATNK